MIYNHIIEGEKETIDRRREAGIYDKVVLNMDEFNKRNLLYGVSITITTDNLDEVTSIEFIGKIYNKGVKAIIYVEYVPVEEKSKELAVDDNDRKYIKNNIINLRKQYDDLIFISFPGDEKSSDGCIAAGRGFFHINATGNAEPCPFSPYSDVNIKNMTLKDALKSKLFTLIRDGNLLNDDHNGGGAFCLRNEMR